MAPEMTRLGVLGVLLAALVGRLSDVARFESVRMPEVVVRSRRRHMGVALDGEVDTLTTPLHYRIRPRALRVLVPLPAEKS